jgi:hypothetical protein
MIRAIRLNRWRALAGITVLIVGAIAYGDEPRADRGKGRVESATERVLARSQGPPAPLPKATAKAEVEAPAERVVATSSSPGFVNPKVEPGKVKWHASLEAACAAAKRSGKPVLLFQMMGKLDDQFC